MSIQIKLTKISTENITEPIPALDSAIPAGFPSPAEGLPSDSIDLNRELISHPSSTFCARVTGDSMIESGISDGDILIIDKSLEARNGSIAVCFYDGEFTLKRISIKSDGLYLEPSNPRYTTIKVTEDANFNVWGIVTYVIKSISK